MKKSALVVLALVLLMAACQAETTLDSVADDADAEAAAETRSDEVAAEPETATESTEAAPATESTEAQPEAEAAEPEPTEPPAPSVDTSTAAAQIGSDDWCTAAQQIEDRFDSIEVLGFSDPEALKANYTEAFTIIDQARAIAPPVIAADVDTTLQGVGLLIDALETAEWDFLDVDLSLLDELDVPMQNASYNIEKYNFDVCGIGTEPTEPTALDETIETDEGAPFTGTVREQVVESLVTSGFSAEEAGCVVDNLDFADAAAMSDPTVMLEVFDDCGISLDRLSQLGS